MIFFFLSAVSPESYTILRNPADHQGIANVFSLTKKNKQNGSFIYIYVF